MNISFLCLKLYLDHSCLFEAGAFVLRGSWLRIDCIAQDCLSIMFQAPLSWDDRSVPPGLAGTHSPCPVTISGQLCEFCVSLLCRKRHEVQTCGHLYFVLCSLPHLLCGNFVSLCLIFRLSVDYIYLYIYIDIDIDICVYMYIYTVYVCIYA